MKPVYVNPIRTCVSNEMKEEIMKYCEDTNTKVSEFLRDAIEFYLKREGK